MRFGGKRRPRHLTLRAQQSDSAARTAVAHAAKRYWRYSDEYLTASTVEAACQWANPILYRMPWGGGIPKTAFMSLTLFSTPTKVGVPGPADSVILPARGARKPP